MISLKFSYYVEVGWKIKIWIYFKLSIAYIFIEYTFSPSIEILA